MKRVVIVVLDSVGCGAAPDAEAYGDAGTDTLGHIAEATGGLNLPNLASLGLGNISNIKGVDPADSPRGAFGKMQERSAGKDTTTGHWEIAGLITDKPFRTFPDGFSKEMIDTFVAETGRGVIGNEPASGTEIIERLGPKHLETGDWIVYTSGDSVFQIAAHEEKVPLDELYAACKVARKLCDPLMIGRVIARPFIGQPGAFERTYNRHDYGMPPHGQTILDRLRAADLPVVGVGKISDIYCDVGVSESIRSQGNDDGMKKTVTRLGELERGLLFVNLIDFDALYGHRRDPQGYGACLEAFDRALPELLQQIGEEDLLLMTADHGNDPTHTGTDHTREYVPLLAYGPKTAAGVDLGTRDGFMDIAQTIADAFDLGPMAHGKSFWGQLT